MRFVILFLLSGMASAVNRYSGADYDEGFLPRLKSCVAGSELEGAIAAIKGCGMGGYYDNCDGRIQQLHDEHKCTWMNLGWGDASGPKLDALYRDGQNLLNRVQEITKDDLLDCSEGYAKDYARRGCDGMKNQALHLTSSFHFAEIFPSLSPFSSPLIFFLGFSIPFLLLFSTLFLFPSYFLSFLPTFSLSFLLFLFPSYFFSWPHFLH